MWSNVRPPSRSSVGDNFNNNSNANPYSRSSAVTKNKAGRSSTDPWDWGWDGDENNTSQQEDWNSPGWGQSSVQNIISNPPLNSKPNMFSQPPKQDKSTHRTPDLIPDKPNNRGLVYPVDNQRFSNTQQQQQLDFFENIDLVSNSHKSSTSPKLYNPTEVEKPQPGADPMFSYFQQHIPPVGKNNPQNIPYFRQSSSPHVPNTEQVPFYQQYQQHPNPPLPQQFNPSSSVPRQQQYPQRYTSPPLPQQQHHLPPLPYQQGPASSAPQPHHPPPPIQPHHPPPPIQPHHPPPPMQPHQPPPPIPHHPPSVPQLPHPLPGAQPHHPPPTPQPHHPPPTPQPHHPPPTPQPHHPPPTPQPHHPPPPTQPHHPPPPTQHHHSPTSYYQNYKAFQTEPTNHSNNHSFYDQNSFNNNGAPIFSSSHSASEVENVEVPTVSKPNLQAQIYSPTQMLQDTVEDQGPSEHLVVPDNQETVPEDEAYINTLPSQMYHLKLESNEAANPWNNTSSCENQEVTTRCELDRNQYLETGQLESGEPEDSVGRPDLDNNDDGEALPPPGLHRMVTGQVTDSLTQRSVLGQPSSESVSDLNGLQRLIPGQQTHSDSPALVEISGLQRLIPGQINNEDTTTLDTNTLQRMVPGHNSQLQRLIPGQQQTDPDEPAFQRLIPGQISDDESVRMQDNTLERMVPGGISDQNSLTEDGLDERMVPGGLSDMESQNQNELNDDSRLSLERMIPGRTTQLDLNNRVQSDNAPVQPERRISADMERQVTIGSIEPQDPPMSQSSGEGGRHLIGQRADSVGQGLHRRVLGHTDNTTDINRAQTPNREDGSLAGNQMPPRLQRMVLGQFREKDADAERDPVSTEQEKVRDEDSDSDYHIERRKPRRRKESYEEEGRIRDYSSERDYRGRRDEREKYRRKQDHGYNRSPDYRSDQDEYDRLDYRDRRDRDRRDRPRDRDRRRRSPDYNYDAYYREDMRKPPRDRRGDRDRFFDNFDDDHYYRENRSRPSSRSGSDYRRPVPRDYLPRNTYYPDPVNNYQLHYYQMQQYYENMRRNDPQAYAAWYERYMAEKYASGNTSYGNDRASVHSGRSSANIHDRGLDEEADVTKVEEEASLRSTPAFFQSAHIRAEFNSFGQIVMIYPQDAFEYGDHRATVDICKLSSSVTSADNDDVRDFLNTPGPFIVGVTHKNTVLQYLKRQIDTCHHSSEKLLYELICLVIKLNGIVDMTDVADLLMTSYKISIGETDPYLQQIPEVPETSQLTQHQITCRFRELLLEGNKTEALDWAMKNGSWGHALFLASKMDSRTHNNVMLRFANGLQTNDPLQTLYQLMSGREPQAATCAADKRWGDWRPHLAMMLSNRTLDPELDRKAILSLGHSLGSRGRIFACHFCYLTAQLDFSSYTDRNSNKLVLLGSSPDLPFNLFSSCRSIMLTMCYEYAKQLSSKDYSIPSLRLYKFLLAVRLIDHNQFTPALAYLEVIAEDIMRTASRHDQPLVTQVIRLADKIKFADSSFSVESDSDSDPDWLARLRHLEESSESNFVTSNLSHGISTSTVSDTDFYTNGEIPMQVPLVSSEVPKQQNYYDNQQMWTNSQVIQPSQEMLQAPGLVMEQNSVQQSQENPGIDYWSNNSMQWSNIGSQNIQEEQQQPESIEPEPKPQISVKPGFGYYATTEEHSENQVKPPSPEKVASKPKPTNRTSKDKVQQSGSGWFGGIWDKLALRPKNQMKLPDDKNPSIVWDEKGKRWVNTESNGEGEAAQVKPPPRADELPGFTAQPAGIPSSVPGMPASVPGMPASMPGMPASVPGIPASVPATTLVTSMPPAGPNKYKLQRGKGMRGNYIDVMNQGNKKPAVTVPTPEVFSGMQPTSVPQNMFIPAPITGNDTAPVDFITQSGPVSFDSALPKHDDPLPTLSRSSSASSLSREVSYYMNRQKAAKRLGGYDNQAAPPIFYNPSSFPT